ncbi:pyridoxamine 5'-phosphate oxidase family protein [Aurantiacibacter poecillastricola]|uniref:pyridoxamine 5'-phosphate oxidase family protein n=1 Tax=Aurantiacibacter poecillastricola TaxID=3064385 RepID=UPI00273D63C9|nr:pyridoxamine 5'-phosphate oxidase family protein [Aurantiacibacter sp. 219JJ12-13]MDP5263489.1 pyridoxamine 5'-phosphate oxidase family protein [Aurantiacibacter sp. 219JJ12-13]
MARSLEQISDMMQQIDFCMLVSRAQDGSLAGRPMSNNQQVAYEGTSYYFTSDDTRMVEDIGRDASVGLTYRTPTGADGQPGTFIHVEAEARLVRDKNSFREHWVPDLERWFQQGIDTPGLVLIEAQARRIHYWAGEDEGEVPLPGPTG